MLGDAPRVLAALLLVGPPTYSDRAIAARRGPSARADRVGGWTDDACHCRVAHGRFGRRGEDETMLNLMSRGDETKAYDETLDRIAM